MVFASFHSTEITQHSSIYVGRERRAKIDHQYQQNTGRTILERCDSTARRVVVVVFVVIPSLDSECCILANHGIIQESPQGMPVHHEIGVMK